MIAPLMIARLMIARLKPYALPLSLAVNVFFLAMLAVPLWHHPPRPPRGGPMGLVEEIAGALPAEDAVRFRAAFADPALARRPPPGPGGEDLRRINAALLAEPFDAAALETAFGAHQDERQRFDRAFFEAFVRGASTISAEGRRKLVEWQTTHRPPPPHR